jgi:hypothetical protein
MAMSLDQDALATLLAKEEIRELAMLYSRGVDRKDPELLRTLYAKDSVDMHGWFYEGPAEGYVDALERSMPHMPYSGHHICNHLVSVDGETGEGEVYAIAYHIIPDGQGGYVEDVMGVRYVDRYRKEDGRWKFAARVVEFDFRNARPIAAPEGLPRDPAKDASYVTLSSRLFARGPRA